VLKANGYNNEVNELKIDTNSHFSIACVYVYVICVCVCVCVCEHQSLGPTIP